MYFIQKDKSGPTTCELMYGCYPLGDAGNPAYYWTMRYYGAGKTVDQLVRIGALTRIEAARIDNANSALEKVVRRAWLTNLAAKK